MQVDTITAWSKNVYRKQCQDRDVTDGLLEAQGRQTWESNLHDGGRRRGPALRVSPPSDDLTVNILKKSSVLSAGKVKESSKLTGKLSAS